jgi:hypothetical protein
MPAALVVVLLALATTRVPEDNHPPEFTSIPDSWHCEVDMTCTLVVSVRDVDGDTLTVTANPLPEGATFLRTDVWGSGPAPSGDRSTNRTYTLKMKPTADQTGEYPVNFTVSDGQTPVIQQVMLEVTEEWNVYALPGVQAMTYWPRQSIKDNGYEGISVECVSTAWAHRNNRHGPSHGRVYVDLDLLFPASGHGGNMYAYTLGADLTVERNPSRRFLLPYFGAELGGIHSSSLGNYFIIVPQAGVHVWADRNLWVNVAMGYVLPGRDLDHLSGAWAKAGLNLSFW